MAISVLIGTHNSEKYLKKVIDCVKDYDEVLIYDKGSTDSTVEIAEAAGCTVLHMGCDANDLFFSHNQAIHKAKNDWILFLRPYELAPRSLRDYLEGFITDAVDVHGLFIPRRHFILDREDSNHYPDFKLRFFHRGGAVWNDEEGAIPSLPGRTSRIPAHMKNLAIIRLPESINEEIGNLEEYWGDSEISPQKIPLSRILTTTMATFMKEYIMKGKFRYGTAGYIAAVNHTMKDYFILAKKHEKHVMAGINDRLK